MYLSDEVSVSSSFMPKITANCFGLSTGQGINVLVFCGIRTKIELRISVRNKQPERPVQRLSRFRLAYVTYLDIFWALPVDFTKYSTENI